MPLYTSSLSQTSQTCRPINDTAEWAKQQGWLKIPWTQMPLLRHLGYWTCNFPEQALLGAEAQSGLKVLKNNLTACSHSVFLQGSQSCYRQQSQHVALGVSPGPQSSWPPLCSWAIMASWKNSRVSKIELCEEWKEHTLTAQERPMARDTIAMTHIFR